MRPTLDLSAYLVLDPDLCGGIDGMAATAAAAARAGIVTIQLRMKDATTAERVAAGRRLRTALSGTGAALIVNDDPAAAVRLDAAGLHVGQGDMPPAKARAIVGPARVLGLSVETVAQASAVDPALVDHVGAGPVFATPTKADAAAPLGWDGLAAVVAACPVPAVAIGGLRAEHAPAAFAAGAAGLAVVSAICGQPDPAAAAALLRRSVDRAFTAEPGDVP